MASQAMHAAVGESIERSSKECSSLVKKVHLTREKFKAPKPKAATLNDPCQDLQIMVQGARDVEQFAIAADEQAAITKAATASMRTLATAARIALEEQYENECPNG